MSGSFSDRHGYRSEEKEITVREDAPVGLRFAIPLIAQDAGLTPTTMRKAICSVLLVRPDPNNWSDYPNVWDEVNGLVEDCPWFKVYDIAEALYNALAARPGPALDFQERLNQYFRENGVG